MDHVSNLKSRILLIDDEPSNEAWLDEVLNGAVGHKPINANASSNNDTAALQDVLSAYREEQYDFDLDPILNHIQVSLN